MYKNYADALRKEFGIERQENKKLYNIGMSMLKRYRKDKKDDVNKAVKRTLSKISKDDFMKEALKREEDYNKKFNSKSQVINRKEDMHKPRYVYMMKIYVNNEFSGIVKIGYSKSISKREQDFNSAISKFGYSARKYMHVECKNVHEAETLEQSLHLALNKFKYTSTHKFRGSTELFNYDERMDILFDFKYL